MSLLQEIREAAVDSKSDLATVLRKCKVLAVSVGRKDFATWVDRELNGYPSKDELPEYRILRGVECRGDFVQVGGILKNAPFNLNFWPPDLREMVTTAHLGAGVSIYASLLADSVGRTIGLPWPDGAVAAIADEMYVGMRCIQAWQIVPRAAVIALLENVRSRVLDFAHEMEVHPGARAGGLSDRSSSPEPASQVFNISVWGGQNVLASGSNFTQSVQSPLAPEQLNALNGFIQVLKRSLPELGLEANAQAEARAEIGAIESQLASPRPKRDIIASGLGSLKAILESAVGSAVATGAGPVAAQLLEMANRLGFLK